MMIKAPDETMFDHLRQLWLSIFNIVALKIINKTPAEAFTPPADKK